MNNKQCLTIAVLAAIFLSFSSCKSNEEKVISKIERLSERIDKNGHKFTAEDWVEAFEDLEDIHEEMEYCEFTREELMEVGRADGRLTAIITKEGAKSLSRNVSSFLKDFSSYFKGFQEGVSEDFSKEDLDEIGDEIMNTLKDIEDEWTK
jgi:aldehyde:ferredoxin oxidoreductase